MLLTVSTNSAARISLTQSPTMFITPLMRLTPNQRWLWTQLRLWVPPHSESNACPLCWWDPLLLGDRNTSTCLRAPSRLAYEQSKPSVMGFLLLGVPTLQQRFPLSEPLMLARSADRIQPTRTR